MKRLSITCILALSMAVLVDVSFAQSGLPNTSTNLQGNITATAEVPVLATVIRPLLVTSTQAVDFGFVTAPASGTTSYTQLQSGQVTISGDPGATVSITRATTLVSGLLNLGTGVDYQPAALQSSVTLSSGGGSATSETITINGTLQVGDTASGDYSGTDTIEFAYTSI